VPSRFRIVFVGDSTTLRAASHFRSAVGDCRQISDGASQSEWYPRANTGLKSSKSGAGRHWRCNRGIHIWFHAFTIATEVGYDARRHVDQFDFGYLRA
jgi:hypothetical protein